MADKKISQLTAASTPVAGTEVFPAVQSGATVKVTIDDLFNRQASYLSVLGADRATNTYGNLHVVSTSNAAAYNGGTLSFGGKAVATGGQYLFGGFKFMSDPASGTGWDTYATMSLTNADSSVSEKFSFKNNGNLTALSGNIVIGTAGKGIDFSANTHAAGMTSELLNDYEEGNWTPVLHRETGGAITASYNTQTGKYVKVGNLVTVSGFVDVASVSAQGSGANEIKGLPYAPANNTLDAGSVSRNNAFTTDVVHSCFGWSDGRILFSSNVNSNAATAVDWKAGYVNFTFSYFV